MADTEKKVCYGLWDEQSQDLVLLPGPDSFCRAVYQDLSLLKFCLGITSAKIVKLTVEPLDTAEPVPTIVGTGS